MKKKSSKPLNTNRLRQKAEEKKSQTNINFSESDMRKLIHELEVHQIDLEMQNEELVATKEQAEQAEQKYISLFDFAPTAYFNLTPNGDISELNLAGAKMLRKERNKLVNTRFSLFLSSDTRAVFNDLFAKALTDKKTVSCEVVFVNDGNGPIYAQLSGTVVDDGKHCLISALDITERKQTENYLDLEREILQILNEPCDLQESVQRVLSAVKTRTGCDAVGLRLKKGDDFPYYVQDGFSKDFLLTENTLLARGEDGGLCRDKNGNVSLECTCGLVISGKTNPSNQLFTKGGSSWTNNSFLLLDLPADRDPRLHPRNNCIHKGYASVALVPIRNKDRIVGLIQLNVKRKDWFTLQTIEILESIASHIGSALMRKQAEQEIQEKNEEITTQNESIKESNKALIAAKEKAEESEKSFRNIFESHSAIMLLIEPDTGKIVHANKSAVDFYGYDLLTLRSMYIQNINQLSQEQIKAERLSALTNNCNYFIFPHKLSNGKVRTVEVHSTAINYEGKQILFSIIHDITERKEAEIKMAISEAQYRKISESAPVAIAIQQKNKIVFVNQEGLRMIGAETSEQVIGKDFSNFVHPDNLNEVQNRMQRMKNGEQGLYPIQDKYIRLDGEIIDVEVMASPLTYNNEPAVEIIITDITERKKMLEKLIAAKEKIEENEERFQKMLALIPDMISIIDSEMNIVYSNWNGYASVDKDKRKTQTKCYRTFRGYDEICPDCRSIEVLKTKKALQAEIKHSDGRWIDLRVIPVLNNNGKVENIIEWIRDITQSKLSEEELHKTNNQLKRLARHLQNIREEERLVISRELHDNLGQSLTAMRMELFHQKKQIFSSEISKNKSKLLEDYDNMVVFFDSIVKSVREISRNIRPSVIEDLGLIPAIEMLLTDFEQRYHVECDLKKNHNLTIKLEIKDLIGIYRIAQEALTNIVKHANATKVFVSIKQTKEEYCIKISDNGIGYNAKSSENKKSLGIIGMKERAFMFNGTINISGTPGKGTIIELTIPKNQQKTSV